MVVESFHLLDSSSDSDSSEQSTSTRSSDASSSNHMEHNSESCAAQTDNLKELIGTLTRERSIKGLTRMCSSKYRRKGAKVPNYLKATKCSVVRKLNLQASSPNLNTAASPRNKPLSVLRRTTTLRPKRRLAKLVSLRPRRPSMKSCSEVSPSMGSGVQRATCSSTYKNSKFPALIGIQPGDDVSVVSPAAKVCSFSYCTLHGSRHTAAPSLKRLKSARKRVRTQRSKKSGGRCEIGAQGLLLHNSTKDVEEKDIARNEFRHCSPIGSAESTGKPDASRSKGEMPQAVIALSGDGEEMMDKLLCVDEVSHIESTTVIQLNAAREVVSESDSSNGDSVKASFGRRKLTGLWRLIHQQVVSDVAENGGLEFPVHRLSTKEEEKEDGYDWAATPDEAGQQEELRETDAIKLVRDAITRILAQSQTSSSNEGIVLEKAATREVNSEETISPDVEEEQLSVDKTPNINKKPVVDAAKKPNPLVSKRWSNVKKYVMMRRFITVMEKMRTFKPRIPRSLSSEEYHEQERVSLRHQSIEERKNSEEWMLDYALRKVVSELEPAQKRKVALLVHAFEIVNPVPGSGSRLKPTGSYASISEESPSSEDGDFSEISNGEVQKSKNSQTSTLEHSISEDIGIENGVISKDVEEDHGKVYIANNTNNGGYLEEVQQIVEIVQGFTDEEGQGMDQASLLDSAPSSELLSSVESIGDSVKASLGSRKFSGLWNMIHQQMVSEVAENGGLVSPVCQGSIKEPEENGKKLPETNGSGYNSATSESSGAVTPEEAIQQTDVIKLLREAVNKILAQTEKQSLARQTSNQLVSKRWSNVKKYVLMRRFIKAMEKMRTLRPRIPRSPSSEVYAKQEKVSLRSQSIGERKNSEEWMLDYALRKVISELDPPQQRKVGLLVQAFEKVSPFPGRETQIKPSVQNVSEIGIENRNSAKTGLIMETQHEGGEAIGSHPSPAVGDGPVSGIEKEDGLWFLIYKRMTSGLESEGATQLSLPIFDGDKGENKEEKGMESEGITQSKLEAVKLVQQAIDEILLPDYADSSVDDQDAAKGTIPEKGPENKGCSKEARDLSVGENINDQFVQSTPDSRLESYCAAKLEENAANQQEVTRSVTPAGNNWNNLRKAILLKRFVKALEKVRTFNPQQPRYLPLELDEDPERVNLRRQESEDRKNGEAYLLDYALQQVVSKLTPARKKKVHLLVEAFETITPHLGK